MIILSIILVGLGIVSVVFGSALLGDSAGHLMYSNTPGGSLIFFGVIVLLGGIVLLLSAKSKKMRDVFRKIAGKKEFILIVVLVASIYLFWAINNNYLSPGNIRNIFASGFVMAILGVGMTSLLISGKIDMSIGATAMMAGIIIAFLLRTDIPWGLTIVITLLFGVVTGLINAFFVNVLKFIPFISTLAISVVYGGLSLVVTNTHTIAIGNRSFLELGSMTIWIFPFPFFVALVLSIVYGVILSATGFGRRVYMVGGNTNAARLAGIKPHKIITVLFVNTSVIACVAGILFAAQMHSGSPTAILGSDLDAITAVVLGGVAFSGGKGNMLGVFVGILLISSFQNGLVVVGLGAYYRLIAQGLLLVAALVLDHYREVARQKALLRS